MFTRIRNVVKALFYFRKACQTKQIVFPYSPHVVTAWEENYEDFFSEESLASLKKDVDDRSCAVLDLFFHRLKLFLELRKHHYYALVLKDPFDSDAIERKKFEKECQEYKKYGLPSLMAESLYFHHGLRNASVPIKKYIERKIFIDGGACCGDSSLTFMQYNPSKVIAFDVSPRMAKKFHQIMKKNNIPETRVQLILKGLGETQEIMTFDDKTIGSTTLRKAGKSKVEIIPLDSCKEIDGTVGLIKFDLEGFGLHAFKGMLNTIKKDRPVLALAVYHCGAELFGIKELLDSLNLNYKVEYKSCFFDHYGELTMFAYPKELDVE
ncbi:MAG: FkbM family methyltransferase [Lentisphaerae bacterium]|nr:FkbM family methyltransferase [Lentisphaerota bacterium]